MILVIDHRMIKGNISKIRRYQVSTIKIILEEIYVIKIATYMISAVILISFKQL